MKSTNSLSPIRTVSSSVNRERLAISPNRFSEAVALIMLAGAFISATAQDVAPTQTTASNEWTWMGGSSTLGTPTISDIGEPGTYGTMGTPASGNIPGGRSGAASWTDKSGNFWLFGGAGFDANGAFGALNDLWEFSPSTNEWAWMGGSNTVGSQGGQSGIYGTLKTPAPGNTPGGRSSAASWIDSSGNLWLFGGTGFDVDGRNDGLLCDLWEYSPATKEWAWMGGSDSLGTDNGSDLGEPGVYGTIGVPAPGNIPGGRIGSSSWADKSGNFWLFGGYGYDGGGFLSWLGDVWKFSTATGEWTWMGGSGRAGSYGTAGKSGVFAAGNVPGCHSNAAFWTDTSGNFWLHGGYGCTSFVGGYVGALDELWEFNPSVNQWAWISGSYEPATFGTLGVPAPSNDPGQRQGTIGWTDKNDNFWLFGNYQGLNDLWEFTPSLHEWTWMGGNSDPNQPSNGVYGTLGVPAPGNIPGTRGDGAHWIDSGGNLWLFGGNLVSGNFVVYYNDLWRYQPSGSSLTASTPTFSVASGTYDSAQTVAIADATSGATIYYTLDGSTPTNQSSKYSTSLQVSQTTTINAIAEAAGYSNSAVASATYTIAIPVAATPVFSPAVGTYTTAQTVALTDSTSGASIYYTTNGTTPTANSTLYTGAITVSATKTIEAIAVAPGYTNSLVATGVYTINLPTPSFTVGVSPAAVTVATGQSGTVAVSVTPQNGFNSAVTFACGGLPAGATCSFSPATVTPSGAAAAKTTLTVATGTAAANRDSRPVVPGATLAFALCLLGWRKRRGVQLLLVLTVSFAGLSLLSACGGGSSSSTPQPSTSTVTITATSGAVQNVTSFALTVK